MLRDLQGLAQGLIVDVVRLLRDSLEDSTASNPSLTCYRNDGQEHGLSTLCNINAILWSFAYRHGHLISGSVGAGCVISARKNLGSPSVRSSSPHVFTVTFTCCSVRCDHEL